MRRADFLKLGLAAPLGKLAKALDPGGEPMREIDGQLIVNAPNTVVQNVIFRTAPTPTAVRLGNDAHGSSVTGCLVAPEESPASAQRLR
jgi:hypothetical protein